MIEKECERLLRQYISKDMSPAEYVDEDIKLLATEIHTVFPQLTDKIQINDIKKFIDKFTIIGDGNLPGDFQNLRAFFLFYIFLFCNFVRLLRLLFY